MKRLFIYLLLMIMVSSASAALTNGVGSVVKPTAYWWHGDPIKDTGLLWMKEMEGIIEDATLDNGNLFTFDNGATISNVTDTALIFLEEDEDFKWTFAGTSITATSSTGIVLFDYALIVPAANQFLVNPISAAVGTVEGTIRYDSDDDKFYGRDNDSWVEFGASAGTPAGSDTYMQYNDNSSFGGISTIIWDGTNLEFANDQAAAFGTDADWTANFDDSVADQMLWETALTQAVATGDPMFQILVDTGHASGTSMVADQQVFGIAKGSQGTNVDLFIVDEDGDVTIGGTFYQAAIASAASGVVNLTVDASSTGSITIGGISTGATIFPGDVDFTGDSVDIGNLLSNDTLSIQAKIDTDVYLDDDSTNSPKLYFRDDGENYWSIHKADTSTGNLVVTSELGTSDFHIVAGNVAVGTGSPSIGMDGEDLYVKDDFEVDGDSTLDGAVTVGGVTTLNGDVAINDQIAVAFNANDEEFAITGTATNMTAAAMATLTMAAQDSTKHILRLIQTPDADAENEFLLLEDNAGDDKFEIEEGGNTIWTLTDNAALTVNAAAANTTTTGIINLDLSTSTTTAAGIDVKVTATTTTGEIATGIRIDMDDDTAGTGTLYGLSVGSSDSTPAGGAGDVTGIGILTGIDIGVAMALDAGSVALTIDAETAENTSTAGIIDIGARMSESGAKVLAIDVESEADGAGEEVYGIYVEMDDDADNADNEIHGIHVAGDGTDGTGLQHAIVVSGANIDAGLRLETGYLRIGTSAATQSLGDDDAHISGTLEIDGALYAEGAITGDGVDAISGFVKTVTNDTDGKVLTIAESGTIQTNAGASGAAAWTLPGAVAGLEYGFVVMAAFELRVTPAGGDKIYYDGTAMAAAEYRYADAVGEYMHIVAVDATNWVVTTETGTWAEETP